MENAAFDPDPLLEELVTACLERIESEGPAALEAVCAENPAHAARLRELVGTLQQHGMLDDDTGAEGEFPEHMGDFQLLERLGAGGMGIVYRARQVSLGREVALKLVRPEQMWFGVARERFRREVEATARMQHPGIVPIFMVGEESGVPYFAMELVDGASLGDVLEKLRGRRFAELTGADLLSCLPGEGSSPIFDGAWWVCAARIARELAEALEHAHRRGVLHRDLKPSNVMITRAGRVLLVDFGLAASAGGERLTRTGSQLGSLPYLPPEQIEHGAEALDARSEVYGLGVTLYELLTGELPWRGDSAPSILSSIAEGRPPAPRRVNPSIPPDLETVCLTAMERDPDRRYASAADLARDLANVVEHRPIEARAAGPVRHIVRWTQRRPAHATALALALALVLGAPTALWLQQRTANAKLFERSEGLRAQRDRATRNLELAGQSIEQLLVRVRDPSIADQPGVEALRRELLEDALALNSELARIDPLDPGAEARSARALRRLAEIEYLNGRYDTAVAHADASIAASSKVPGADGELARAHLQRARALRGLHRNEDALQSAELAAELSLEPEDPAEHVVWRQSMVRIESFRAELCFYLGRTDEGIERQRALVVMQRELCDALAADGSGKAPERITAERFELASMSSMLGYQIAQAGRLEEAREVLAEAVAISEECLEREPLSLDMRTGTASAQQNLGAVLGQLQRPADAEPPLRRALELYEQLTHDYPTALQHIRKLNACRLSLGGILTDTPEGLEEGVQILRDAIASLERLCAAEDDDPMCRSRLAQAVGNLAACLVRSDPDEAMSLFRRAIDENAAMIASEPKSPEWSTLSAEWLVWIGMMQMRSGDLSGAEETLVESDRLMPREARFLRRMASRWSFFVRQVDRRKSLEDEERARLRAAGMRRGLDALRAAIEAGYGDVEELRTADELESLRQSDEWPAIEKAAEQHAAQSP